MSYYASELRARTRERWQERAIEKERAEERAAGGAPGFMPIAGQGSYSVEAAAVVLGTSVQTLRDILYLSHERCAGFLSDHLVRRLAQTLLIRR
jgi:hypothetical protein